MSKYPKGKNTHICKECGRPLGLRTPIWWRSHKLCKKLYSTRWWRDWRERWLARIYTRPT
jgi:hypothetical protein